MSIKSIVGIILILVGILSYVYPDFSFTTTERAVDIGPIQVNHERERSFPLLGPVAGGIAIVCGILMLAVGGRRGTD